MLLLILARCCANSLVKIGWLARFSVGRREIFALILVMRCGHVCFRKEKSIASANRSLWVGTIGAVLVSRRPADSLCCIPGKPLGSGRIIHDLSLQQVFARLAVLDTFEDLVDRFIRRCEYELLPGWLTLFEHAATPRVEERGKWSLEAFPTL
jgi:hypothetical protein